MAPVVIYTTDNCSYCVRAKALLSRRSIPFQEIDVTADSEARAMLVRLTGRRTVPQIFIDGEAIGGFTELVELDRAGRLAGPSG